MIPLHNKPTLRRALTQASLVSGLAAGLALSACGQPAAPTSRAPAMAPDTPAPDTPTTDPAASPAPESSGRFNFGLPGKDEGSTTTVTEGGFRFEAPAQPPGQAPAPEPAPPVEPAP